MEVEYCGDPAAYRRHSRGMILFVSAVVLYLPVVLVNLALLAAVLGREPAGAYAGAVWLAGFAALIAVWFYGAGDGFCYRCLRCGRRLTRAAPQGRPAGPTRPERLLPLHGLPGRVGSRMEVRGESLILRHAGPGPPWRIS